MKKLLVIIIFMFCSIPVYAFTNSFKIDSSKLAFSTSGKKELLLDKFNKDYELSRSISSENSEKEQEIIDLTKRTTYLLLGDFNNNSESSEDYYKRHQEYLKLGAYHTFPKDKNSKLGYDESIENYQYAVISSLAVPQLFIKFNDLDILYSNYGDIRISISKNLVMSIVYLPKVKMKEENPDNPLEYNLVETDLVITYYFLKINDEYKLAYLFGNTGEEIDGYFASLENNEEKSTTMQAAPAYDSNLKELFDFSKLNSLDKNIISNIYDSNKNRIVILNSYYNNYSIASANGFFISDGLIITTWNFMEKSLKEAQFFAIKDNNGKSYEIDGIVTANPETDIVIIKLKNKTAEKVSFGDSKELKVEDPVISISSKTGVGLTTQKGIVISNDGYLQSSIPLLDSDAGSPLFNKDGKVVGMNTSKQVNSSVSLAISSEILIEVQEKFKSVDFDKIEVISFDKLKEQFYYVKYNDELISNKISSSNWKKYSKIGNIEDTIKLKLIKASYRDGAVSLRYKNGISNYISSMQLAGAFKDKLLEQGYEEILSSDKKSIYKNKKYQVVIMDEFDYLIVVMVKL